MESCQTSPNNREKERFWYCKKDLRLLYFCLQGTKCCNYGADGKKIVTSKGGYDCILIPGASLAGAIKPNKICGNNMGIITATGITSATLCCKSILFINYQFFILPKVIIHKSRCEVSLVEQDTIERVSVAQWFQLVLFNPH